MYNVLSFVNDNLLVQQSISDLMKCNEETMPYQLQMSKEDARLLIDTRKEALKVTDRIELGGGVIEKLVMTFKDSPYISQYNYVETISELIDTFYYYKNESLEEISDDDLIELMKELFDHRCNGSMELLQGREMDRIAHNIRFGTWDFGTENNEEKEEEADESDESEE